MNFLLDTDICIYIIKKEPQKTLVRFKQHPPKNVFISSVSVFELLYGVEKSQKREKNRQALALFLHPLTIVPFDDSAASVAAKICATLEQEGQPIGPYDIQIAGVAISREMTLVSNNDKEFKRVKGLNLENWAKD